MKPYLPASRCLGRRAVRGIATSAEITMDAARAILAPFYKALNAEFVKDAPELVRQTTTPDWKYLPRATMPAIPAMKSWPGSDSGSKPFRT